MVDMFMNGILIIVLWYAAFYTVPNKNVDRIQEHQKETGLFEVLFTISYISVIVVIVVDIGAAFFGHVLFFYALKEILSLSIFSRLLNLCYLFVVFKGTTRLTRTVLRSESYIIQSRIDGVSFANGIAAVGVSTLIIFMQSTLYGEMRYLYGSATINIWLELLINGIFYLIPGVFLIINGIRYIQYESVSKEARHLIIPINLFMSVGYIVVVKAISLYMLVFNIKKAIFRQLKMISRTDDEDFLLIGTSLNSRHAYAKVNVYYLLASFLVYFVLLYFSGSAYPMVETAYNNGHFIVLMFIAAIFMYFIVEQVARVTGAFGRLFRAIFIPLYTTGIIWPFYTIYAEASENLVDTKTFSVFHELESALGEQSYLIFLCVFGLMLSVSYFLHIITGEFNKEKHPVSLIPIIGWLQLTITVIWFPILVLSPPYALVDMRMTLLIIMGILIIGLVFLIANLAYTIFSSERSKLSLYMSDFWKKRWRLYLMVSFLTLLFFTPLILKVVAPIENMNIGEQVMIKDVIHIDDAFTINHEIHEFSDVTGYIFSDATNKQSRMIVLDMFTGDVKADMNFSGLVSNCYVWNDHTIAFEMADNEGFKIIDINVETVIFETERGLNDFYESLDYSFNNEAVLVTLDDSQYIYHVDKGYIELDIIGNNYYELLQGVKTILYKNKNFYELTESGTMLVVADVDIRPYEYIYVKEDGYIVYDDDQLFLLDAEMETIVGTIIDFENTPLDFERLEYFFNDKLVTFTLSVEGIDYQYICDTNDLSYRLVKLEEQIKTNHDKQKISVYNTNKEYLLYDDIQLSVYENDHLVARHWFDFADVAGVDLVVSAAPIVQDNRISWLLDNKHIYIVSIVGDEDGDY